MPRVVPGRVQFHCQYRGIGIFLALSFLYRGIPFVMQPDPSNALGLFFFCSVLLIGATGLAHFVAVLVLDEKIFT